VFEHVQNRRPPPVNTDGRYTRTVIFKPARGQRIGRWPFLRSVRVWRGAGSLASARRGERRPRAVAGALPEQL
jgi:hypothetical protein